MTFMHSLRVCKLLLRILTLSRHCMATAMKIKMMQMEQKEQSEDETDCNVISPSCPGMMRPSLFFVPKRKDTTPATMSFTRVK